MATGTLGSGIGTFKDNYNQVGDGLIDPNKLSNTSLGSLGYLTNPPLGSTRQGNVIKLRGNSEY